MIGHQSIVSGEDIHCECGHVLVPATQIPNETTWTSEPDPFSFQAIVERLHAEHVAQHEADGYLYGFDGDEYLENSPEAVYEAWADDHDYDPPNMLMPDWGRPDSLEIIEWSSNPGDEFLPSADRVLDWMAETYGDECCYDEAADQIMRAASEPDVIELLEQARRLMLSKIRFRFADTVRRQLTVTWDDNGEPLLDGEPMYRKVKP